MWGAADYTLTPSAGSNNSYTGNCDVTVDGITWNITGNAQQVPWRIGGKSISSVDRVVYSKTAYASAVNKVDLTVGAASSITVNSLKLVYSTNSDFSNSSEISKTFAANSTISFEGEFPANAYYKFVFNVTVSGTSNKFVEFSKVEFYNAEGGDTPEPTKYTVNVAGNIANGAVTANPTSAAKGSTVTLTATPSTGYEFGSWNVTNASTSAAITVTDNKFTMPAANVNVSATFNQIQGGGEEPNDDGIEIVLSKDTYSAWNANNYLANGGKITNTPITFSATGNNSNGPVRFNDNSYIQIYQNTNATFAAAAGYKITNIVFNCTAQDNNTYGPAKLGLKDGETGTYSYSGNDGTWSGSTASVTFTASAQARVNSITITYVVAGGTETPDPEPEPTKTLTSISLSGEYPVEFYTNQPFSHGDMVVTAHYSDAEDEDVTSLAKWENYNMSEAGEQSVLVSYTLGDVTAVFNYAICVITPIYQLPFYETFDSNDGKGGNDGQWLGSIASNAIKSDFWGWTFVKGSGADECIKLGTGDYAGSATTPQLDYSGDAILTFRAAAWNSTKESTDVSLSATDGVTLSEEAISLDKGAWKEYSIMVSNMKPGTTITFAGSDGNNRFFLDDVRIVPCTTLSISYAGYATYYNELPYKMPEGLEGKIMEENTKTGDIVACVIFNAGDVVPAKTALLVKGSEGVYPLPYTEDAPNDDNVAYCNEFNLLRGSLVDELTTGGSVYYKLANGGNGLGWYWGTEGGAAFTNPAHKAYIALGAAVGSSESPRFIAIDFGRPTAIENIETNTNNEIYDLAGRRVKNATNGLYIVNGKKVIR